MTEKITENFTIERMKEEDLEEVLRIEKESFSDPWIRECFLEDIKKELAYPAVVRIGEKLVGYTCLWKVDDELQIANIAVDKEHRGKGIARRLLDWVADQALKQNCKNITLDVRESNSAAIRLYDQYGFLEIGRRKKYYRFPVEDAIIMERKTQG
jgi:ribosomal-protein-alanine N-acetyltransferase